VRNSGKREPGASYSRPRIVKPLVKPIPKREPGAALSSLHRPNHPSLGGKGKREPHHHKNNDHPKHNSGKRSLRDKYINRPVRNSGKREPGAAYSWPRIVRPLVKPIPKREPGAIPSSLHRPDHPSLGGKGKREPLEVLPSLD